jgi:hypothetical protein
VEWGNAPLHCMLLFMEVTEFMGQYDIILKVDKDFVNHVKPELTKHGCTISESKDGSVSINMKNMIHEPIVQFSEKYLKKLDIGYIIIHYDLGIFLVFKDSFCVLNGNNRIIAIYL